MVFNNYAKYYNLLYKDKDYKSEAAYVDGLVKRFSEKTGKTILDIGCGTGIHAALMSNYGYKLTGIDLSEEMIAIARSKAIANAQFRVGNATDFELHEKFDIVTSLFHVLSYQTTNDNVRSMIKNASMHLSEKGLFIFDFWYGPAVLNFKPSVRIKRLEDDEIKVTRLAEPVLKPNDNIVEVNYELLITSKAKKETEVVKEIHPMRYFFKPEIEFLLADANMDILYFNEWLTDQAASESTWGVCCVAQKK
jgi:SAM-dependent methyltransferase